MNQEGAEQKDTPPGRSVAVPDRRSWEGPARCDTRPGENPQGNDTLLQTAEETEARILLGSRRHPRLLTKKYGKALKWCKGGGP